MDWREQNGEQKVEDVTLTESLDFRAKFSVTYEVWKNESGYLYYYDDKQELIGEGQDRECIEEDFQAKLERYYEEHTQPESLAPDADTIFDYEHPNVYLERRQSL